MYQSQIYANGGYIGALNAEADTLVVQSKTEILILLKLCLFMPVLEIKKEL